MSSLSLIAKNADFSVEEQQRQGRLLGNAEGRDGFLKDVAKLASSTAATTSPSPHLVKHKPIGYGLEKLPITPVTADRRSYLRCTPCKNFSLFFSPGASVLLLILVYPENKR